ncbi:MAG: PEP-CTERM sorting domain-containing protein [Burkholderiales bacterium]
MQTAGIAEPITLSVFGAGLAGAIALRRRRNTGAICAV